MSKIIYLIDQPLDDRNYDRFGIRTWIARGWAIEVWDLTALAHPRAWQSFVESGHRLAVFFGYFSIASGRELSHRFSKLEKVGHFIDLAGDSYWPTRARIRLIRTGGIRVICATGSIPSTAGTGEYSLASKLTKALAEQSPRSLFGRLINKCMNRLAAPFIRPGLFVAAGEKSMSSAAHSKNILRAHNFDYDIYLRLRNSCDETATPYGVFLDQDMCSHPEYIYANVPLYATPEKYFPTIRNGLKEIASALGAPIRIAAHPRLSRQSKYTDHFGGISVEYGKTAELISKCSFVVCHYTTAVQFAVLFKKPVIFVTTDELNSSAADRYIKKFADSLGKPVVNLDGNLSDLNWPIQLNIDSKKYEEYRRTYIKTDGSPETTHWDIVIDHLEKSSDFESIDTLKAEARGSGLMR
jgi:hypothetical protein